MLDCRLQPGCLDAGFPFTLTGWRRFTGRHGLRLAGELPRGRYRLRIRLREAIHNQLLLITLNGRRIDALGVPFAGDPDDNWPDSRRDRLTGDKLVFAHGLKQKYHVAEDDARHLAQRGEWVLESAFAVTTAGPTVLELINHDGDDSDGPTFYHGDGIELLGLELLADTVAAPDTWRRRHPGLPMLDAWGWMVYLGFDNADGREPGLADTVQQAVREARARGANLIELNPSVQDGLPFDFEAEGGPVPGTVRSPTTAWCTAWIRDLFRQAADQGMLKQLFIFSITGFREFRTMTPDQIRYFVQRVNTLLGCGQDRAATAAALDGIIYEFFPHDAPRQTDEAWEQNPGVIQMLSGGVTGTAMEQKNNGYSAGWANYTAHWVGASIHHTGYDCLFKAVPYPKAFYQRAGQVSWSYLQGCAESRRLAEGAMVRSGYLRRGFPGRDAAPDWILAQLQGFAERRWRDQDDPVCSALCWEAVSDQIATPDTKRTVYAVSQDPIRAAIAGTLHDTGLGGVIDFRREVDRYPAVDQVRLSRRHEFPANSRFLRNQELELLGFPGKDYSVLQLDLSRSARFYANGQLVRLFQPFFVTTPDACDVIAFHEDWRTAEIGGPLAETEQVLRFVTQRADVVETRRVRLMSDLPALELRVSRRLGAAAGGPVAIASGLGPVPGYQIESSEQTTDRLCLRLHDPEGVLPEACCLILGKGLQNVRITPVISFTTLLAGVHELTVRLVLACGTITAERLRALAEDESFWQVPTLNLPADGREIPVPNPWTVPLTRPLALSPSLDEPCRVREGGWWHYRGVNRSETFGHQDFICVHCRPGDDLRLARHSLIGGQLTWGWGSQYTTLIGDVTDAGNGWFRAPIRVAGITPFIFAPRVRLRDQAAELRLNGAEWLYADGDTVFLPNRPGDYELAWRCGPAVGPRLCRTLAVVEETRATADGLYLRTALPAFVPHDPGFHGWYALVETNGVRRVRHIVIGDNTI